MDLKGQTIVDLAEISACLYAIDLTSLHFDNTLMYLYEPQQGKQKGISSYFGWKCGVVSLSAEGYEKFESADAEVVQWLAEQLGSKIQDFEDRSVGAECYHLKGKGGIKKATQDLKSMLNSGDYPYIIRSDAKGYYAHIRHHKLVGMLNDNGLSREVHTLGDVHKLLVDDRMESALGEDVDQHG